MDAFTIITGLASIIGAIIAISEARKAKNSAEIATSAKNEILDIKNTEEISKVYSETKNIIKELRKVGPTATATKIKGVDNNEIASRVLEYSSLLNEHKSIFNQQNEVDSLCNKLKTPVQKLANAKDADEIINQGKKIYNLINNHLSQIKKELDDLKMK
nr:hypothetical protein [uncultured Carboxylicivirga sp.]